MLMAFAGQEGWVCVHLVYGRYAYKRILLVAVVSDVDAKVAGAGC